MASLVDAALSSTYVNGDKLHQKLPNRPLCVLLYIEVSLPIVRLAQQKDLPCSKKQSYLTVIFDIVVLCCCAIYQNYLHHTTPLSLVDQCVDLCTGLVMSCIVKRRRVGVASACHSSHDNMSKMHTGKKR